MTRAASLFLPSLRGYSRAWLGVDLLAGLTLAAVCVPESMADAKLAAMPPVTGLYAFLAGALGVLLFSTSRQLSVGPDSTIGPMMAVGVGSLVVTTSSPDYSTRIVLLGLLLGVALLAAGAARLGWLADLLSRPVMSGFLSGVGVTVVVGQLHVLLGLPASAGGTLQKFASVAQHLGGVNIATLAVGAAVLAVVLGGERLGPRFPGALVAVIGSLVAVAALGLGDRGVALVGRLPPGLPSLSLVQPAPADVMALVPVAVPIFFVILAQTAATSRGFAVSGGYEVVVDRDFLAVGTASVLSGLAGAFAVNASPTRTGVVAASNGRSQIVNLVAGLLVAAVLLVATGVLADLPEATLGGILVAVGVKLVKWRDLVAVARYSRPEAAIAVVTLLVVAVVGIQEGIYLAIVLALLRRTYLSARPHDAVLGRLPGPGGRVGVPAESPGGGGPRRRPCLPFRRAALLRQRPALRRARPGGHRRGRTAGPRPRHRGGRDRRCRLHGHAGADGARRRAAGEGGHARHRAPLRAAGNRADSRFARTALPGTRLQQCRRCGGRDADGPVAPAGLQGRGGFRPPRAPYPSSRTYGTPRAAGVPIRRLASVVDAPASTTTVMTYGRAEKNSDGSCTPLACRVKPRLERAPNR